MAGIVSYGAYIPIYRLNRELLAQVWGGSKGKGEKAIANHDEDSITLAVEAGIDCLSGVERESVDALFFASTTAPYLEKQSASIIAAACDLRQDILAVDFANSLRAGTIAMKLAIDTVRSGSARKVLVVAADRRVPPPNSEFEPLFGDGAAALLIGEEAIAAELKGSHNLTSEFMDIWRLPEDGQFRTWEDRFVFSEGYSKHLQAAVQSLMKKCQLSAKDLARAAFYSPDRRGQTAMARTLGLSTSQVQDSLFDKVGNTGTALALMNFVAALEEAKPADNLLLANYGDGADAFIFQATENINGLRGSKRGINKNLNSKLMLDNYGKYIKYYNLMQFQPSLEFRWRSSLTATWRDRDQIYRLHGYRCRQCGQVQYPWQKLCMYCQAKEDFDIVKLADKKGQLVTFSIDERAPVPDPPSVLAAVNLEGGGRFFGMLTDRDTKNIKVGMPVEFTFRKIHDNQGIHNYFWKCRPVRE